MSAAARLIGVGVGPGDPELLTLKAIRALREAEVVAHFAKAGNASNARSIIASHLAPDVIELPLLYPVTTEIPASSAGYCSKIDGFHDAAAATVAAHLDAGRTVAAGCDHHSRQPRSGQTGLETSHCQSGTAEWRPAETRCGA